MKKKNSVPGEAIQPKKKKISDEDTEKLSLFNQFRNSKAMPQKPLDRIGKGKSPPNDSTAHMDIVDDQVMDIHFKEEIIMEILCRLPVESLLRFKCVSKPWNTLISDPYFKMKHLNRAKNDQSSQKFLIYYFPFKDGTVSMYSSSLLSFDQLAEDLQKLDCPSSSKQWECQIRSSCNGLVIIQVTNFIDDERRSQLLLWNPSTRESIVLPSSEFPPEIHTLLGLGYDSTSGDYKILHVCTDMTGGEVPGEVLSLRSGSWRRIDKHPLGICHFLSGMHSLAIVNEAFHWIGFFERNQMGTLRNYSVVSFSISDEVYGEVALPEELFCSSSTSLIGVSELAGMLCVHCAPGIGMTTFKLWMLMEYGVKESWKQLFVIEDPFLCMVIPKYIFADGEMLLWSTQIDPSGQKFRTSGGQLWPQCGVLLDGMAFTGSLISPKSLI